MAFEVFPYDPERRCPACGSGPASGAFHEQPVLVVFGRNPQWPCAEAPPDAAPHLCNRCESCGYAWAEESLEGVAPPSPESRAGEVGFSNKPGNPENAAEGAEMAIRKYGTAADQEAVAEPQGMAREAALGDWGESDDQALAEENRAADSSDG